MKNKKLIVGIVIFAVLAFVAYAYIVPTFRQSNVEVTQQQSNSQLVTCNVVIKNPIGLPLVKDGDLTIESMNCGRVFVRSCIGVFGFASDIGTVSLKGDGGQGTSSKMKVSEGTSDLTQLKWCGSKVTSKVSAIVYNENNEQLYVKDYTLN